MNGQRALVLDIGDERWALQGGDIDARGDLVLRIAVVNGDDVERSTVTLPIETSDGSLVVGEPVVAEGWSE